MRTFFYLLAFLLFTSCTTEVAEEADLKEEVIAQWKELDVPNLSVSDSIISTANYIPLFYDSTNSASPVVDYCWSYYHRQAIRKDSIEFVHYDEQKVMNRFGHCMTEANELLTHYKVPSKSLEITLHPNQLIHNLLIPEGKDTAILYKAWGVQLKNISADTVYVGHGKNIDLMLEAQEPTGNWQAMEQKFVHRYETLIKLPLISLPPNHSIVTSMALPRDTSKYKVFRLYLDDNYSQKFSF